MSNNKEDSSTNSQIMRVVIKPPAQANSSKRSDGRVQQKKSATQNSGEVAGMGQHSAKSTGYKMQKSNSSKPSLEETAAKLKSGDNKVIEESLKLVRKYSTKEKGDISKLLDHGILESLLSIIQNSNQKLMNIALSSLANMCIYAEVTQKVLNMDGIDVLAKIVQNLENEDIVHRACRTLTNLSQNSSACVIIHEQKDLIPAIMSRLNTTQDVNFQKTIIKALRLFGDTPSHRRALVDEDCLRFAAPLLKSTDEQLVTATYRAIEILTHEFTSECVLQLTAVGAPEQVVQHMKGPSGRVQDKAYSLIMTSWIHQEEMRVGLGNAGSIPFYIEKINTLTHLQQKLRFVNALCLSCKEVVNRVRIRDNQGLQLILRLLNDSKYECIHYRLISALRCFMYDEQGWQILLSNQLVPTLTYHLSRVTGILRNDDSNHGNETQDKGTKCAENISFIVGSSELEDGKEELGEDDDISHFERPVKRRKLDGASDDTDSGKCQLTPKINSSDCTSDAPPSHEQCKKAPESPADPAELTTRNVYSLDSPTYKAVGDWEDDDYFTGPKNIHDSQYHGAFQQGSPSPQHLMVYSPMSSVGSYDLSPDSSPGSSRAMSPHMVSPCDMSPDSASSSTSPSLRSYIYSPFCTAVSPGSWESEMDEQNVSKSTLQLAADLLLCCSIEDGDSDEGENARANLMSPIPTPEVSSASQRCPPSFTNDTKHTKASRDVKQKPSTSTGVVSYVDSDSSDVDLPKESRGATKPKRLPLSGKAAASRHKRKQTQEKKEKILKSVAISQSSSNSSLADISLILDSSVASTEEQSPNVEIPAESKDQRRITEESLVYMLSHVSHCADPSEHMVNHECLVTMLRYIRWANKPIPRCGRALVRLADNRLCYKNLILKMAPYLIRKHLTIYNEKSLEDQGTTHSQQGAETSSSAVRKLDMEEREHLNSIKQVCDHPSTSRTISRSMSVPSTIGESQRAVQFGQQIRRSTQQSEMRDLKEMLKAQREIRDQMVAQISKLAAVTDSPYGQGVLAHLLQTGRVSEKKITAVAFALICRECEVSSRVLLDLEGLQYLLQVLQTDDDGTLQHAAMVGLLTLADRLNVTFHRGSADHTSLCTSTDTDPAGPGTDQCDVTFVMDNGDRVEAHRAALKQKSPVFSAMLEGHYKESDQSVILLRDVSTKAFQVLVAHLHGQAVTCRSVSGIANLELGEKSEDFLSLILEVHSAADRFLLEDLKVKMCKLAVERCLMVENIKQLVRHALVHSADWLMEQCLVFLLVGYRHGTISKRMKTLISILQGTDGPAVSQVLHDVFKGAIEKRNMNS